MQVTGGTGGSATGASDSGDVPARPGQGILGSSAGPPVPVHASWHNGAAAEVTAWPACLGAARAAALQTLTGRGLLCHADCRHCQGCKGGGSSGAGSSCRDNAVQWLDALRARTPAENAPPAVVRRPGPEQSEIPALLWLAAAARTPRSILPPFSNVCGPTKSLEYCLLVPKKPKSFSASPGCNLVDSVS